MANMNDYLDWRGDLTIDRDGFNDIDNVILSWLATLDLSGGVQSSIADAAGGLLRARRVDEDEPLLGRLFSSKRFQNVKLLDFTELFDEGEQMQFAAFAADTGEEVFIAFRGTDNTLVGWKEDFNMAFMQSVPAQRESVKYVKKIAAMTDKPLMIGGHSKGGNLAVYSACHCPEDIQKRVSRVYNNDGPGLSEEIMESGEYKAVSDRIRTFLPQSSIVGILLYHTEDYRVVRSTAIGPLQHHPSSWQVMGNSFVFEGELRKGSRYMDKTLKKWLESMSVDERRVMVDAIYDVMAAAEIKTFHDLIANWRASGGAIIKAAAGLPPEKRQVLKRVLGELVSAGIENVHPPRDE
ncbi:MAG: DUF2974 domain-containing protein [Clostridia bacterium]|nr:DUF2974 domain-containing protein [Clostridia bacterium]